MDLLELQNQVLIALKNLLDECSYWPDGNCSFPSSLGDALGQALFELSEEEDATFGTDNIRLHQSLRKIILSPNEAKREAAIDAADSLYVGIFHQCLVPGVIYQTLPTSPKGIDYCHQNLVLDSRVKMTGILD